MSFFDSAFFDALFFDCGTVSPPATSNEAGKFIKRKRKRLLTLLLVSQIARSRLG
jgi:hypothetical protein